MLSGLGQDHVDRAFRIARWYARRVHRVDVTDLEGAALEGLTKAARDWDPARAPNGAVEHEAKRSFWTYACTRIIGEMRDELRRLDHLTRNQRALLTEDEDGRLTVGEENLKWINPYEPLPLDASVETKQDGDPSSIVDLVEGRNDPIENFELRDAFLRAGADLSERELFVLVKRELEGYSNSEVADAFAVTEGRASQLRGAAIDSMREQIGDAFVDAA